MDDAHIGGGGRRGFRSGFHGRPAVAVEFGRCLAIQSMESASLACPAATAALEVWRACRAGGGCGCVTRANHFHFAAETRAVFDQDAWRENAALHVARGAHAHVITSLQISLHVPSMEISGASMSADTRPVGADGHAPVGQMNCPVRFAFDDQSGNCRKYLREFSAPRRNGGDVDNRRSHVAAVDADAERQELRTRTMGEAAGAEDLKFPHAAGAEARS